MKKCIIALSFFIIHCKVLAADLSQLLLNLEIKGLELIVSQVDESRFSSSGGHAFLRIITDNYYDDIGISFAPIISEELNWSNLPDLFTGKYPNIMSVDRFTNMWKKSILNEKRNLERYPLNLSSDELNKLIRVLIDWQYNANKIGDYKLLSNNCVVLIHRLFFESKIVKKENAPITPKDLTNFLYQNSLSLFPSSLISSYKSVSSIVAQLLDLNSEDLEHIENWPIDSKQRIDNYLNSLANEQDKELFTKRFLYLFSHIPLDIRKNLSSRYNYKTQSLVSFEDLFSLFSVLRFGHKNKFDTEAFILYFTSLDKEQKLAYLLFYHKYQKLYAKQYPELHRYFAGIIEYKLIRKFNSKETRKFKIISNSKKQVFLAFCQKQTCRRIERRFSLGIDSLIAKSVSTNIYDSEVLALENSLLYIQALGNSNFHLYQISIINDSHR